MQTKKAFQSLTIQAASLIGILEGMPFIVAEINKHTAGDLMADPTVLLFLKICSLIVVVYGRLRADTKIK